MGRRDENEFIVAAREAGQQLAAACAPLLPYLLQAGAAMVGYTGGLAAAQAAGMALRVSCVTPVAGPVGGLLGVGLASAMAGQASIKCRQYLKDPKSLQPQHLFKGVRAEDLLVDAVVGIALFKAMGGRFRSVMPSDLSKVGAIARDSLPALQGPEYATKSAKAQLVRHFRKTGCHHCGKRRGNVIGDHMPPNKHVVEIVKATKRSLLNLPYMRQIANALNIPAGPPQQRYYPQCATCCQQQSAAIRNNRMTLVFHEVLHRGGTSTAWHFAGSLLGLRHYHGGPDSSGGGGGSRSSRGDGRGGGW